MQDDSSPEPLARNLQHRSIASAFLYAYYGQADGSFTQFPPSELPAGYDPRQRPWYKSSAQEIQQMIEQLQSGSRDAVETMGESRRFSDDSVRIAGQAGENLRDVTRRIGEIDGMNQSVATATEEQTLVIESLNMDITEINTLNQDGVRNLQASLSACTELEQQVGRLKQLVDSFRI